MSNYPPPPGQPPYPPPTGGQPPYPPPGQPPYPPPGQAPFPQAQPPKKGGALKWVLIGCGGFIIVGIIAVVAIGWFGYYKAKQLGYDPELMKRNPALAAAKLAIGLDGTKELISIDEKTNTLTVKDKKSGKVVTLTFEQDKNGNIKFKEKTADGKESSMTIKGDGKDGGSIDIETPEGKTKIGSNSVDNLPEWLPQYPGVKIEGNYSTENNESSGVGYNFSTSDSLQQVLSFFESRLKSDGFKITKSTSQTNGQDAGSVVANDANNKHNIVVNASTDGGQTKVYVVSQTNK
ncbi:MAG: hypothetical protein HY231_17635 [Acidobacteria bacterium]|nr:hypothetical protein [Acidobacteriota bacterium]